jgi:parallel beta-helix repeat protein
MVEGDYFRAEGLQVSKVGPKSVSGFGVCFDYGTKSGLITQSLVRNTGLDGIHMRRGYNNTASFNTIENSGDDGIAAIWGHENKIIANSVDRNDPNATKGNGIYIGGESGTLVQGNSIVNSPRYGICVDDFEGVPVERITIAGNIVKNAGYENDTGFPFSGIYLEYTTSSIVTGNTVEGSYYHGIRLYNTTYITVSSNVLSNNHRSPTGWGAGIFLEYHTTYTIIDANQMVDTQATPTQDYGVFEAKEGVDYNIVSDSIARGNAVESFHLEGANSRVTASFSGSDWIT